MKKLLIFMAITICFTMFIIGCSEKDVSPNDLKPMIMIDGIIYLDTGKEEKTDNTLTIDGEILSTVEQTEKPTDDGQSNFGALGSSYSVDDNGVLVQINKKWFRFKAE